MFVPRLLSGIVMLVIAFFAIYFGEWALWGVTLLLSVIGVHEMYKAIGINKKSVTYPGYLTVLVYYAFLMPALFESFFGIKLVAVLVFGFLLIMAMYVFAFPNIKSDDAFGAVVGVIYPGVLMSFLYLTRCIQGGQILTWLIFIAAWGSDTFAYCTGMLCKKFIGTHQMTPKLSPKKSIEGGIGGLFFAALIGYIFGMVFQNDISIFSISVPVSCAIVCLFGGMISMIGDLAASAVKRDHDIKDYGRLIPGHGGVMDRFDSIIFTAPCVYLLITLMNAI